MADRARCTVWELEDAPSWWIARLQLAMAAEHGAANERRVREERRSRMTRR